MVGESSSGDPVFEIRSVRLVLRPDATHFNRVAECFRCGREMPGAAVLSPADLDLTPHPVICKTCVSDAAGPRFDTLGRRPLGPAPTPVGTTASNGSAAPGVTQSAEAARMAALEKGLADLVAQLTSASKPHSRDSGNRLDALERKLDDAIERRVREELQRSELLAALDGRIDELQTALKVEASGGQDDGVRLAGGGEEQARASAEMGRWMDDIAERLTHDANSTRDQVREIGDRLRQLEATVEAASGVGETHRVALEQIDASLAEVETTLTARLERLADGVIGQRSDLLATIDARVEHVRTAVGHDATVTRQQVVGAQEELRLGLIDVTEHLRQLENGSAEALVRAQSESATAARARQDLVRLESRLTERLEGVVAGVIDERSALLSTLEDSLAEVRGTLHRALAETRPDVLRALAGNDEAVRAQEELRRRLENLGEQLNDRLDRLAERSTRTKERDSQALHAVENRVDETVARLTEALESQRSELRFDLQMGLAEVRSTIGAEAERLQMLEDGVAQITWRLSELGAGNDEEELTRLREYLDDRLDRLAERAARTTVAEAQAFHVVQERLDEKATRIAEALELQRSEFEVQLRDGLDEVRVAASSSTIAAAERLQALEEGAVGTARQVSEIEELLNIVDAGFGELKAGMEAFKEADTMRIAPGVGVAAAFGQIDTRPNPRIEPETSRKRGRRSRATAQLAATADELVRRQGQLEAQMMTLERTSEATVNSLARAASQAANLGPLASALKAMREELWAHNEALEKLSRTVEDLRKKTSTPAKVAKPIKAQKAAPATKRAPRKPKTS